jgi:glycine cleavage system H protein
MTAGLLSYKLCDRGLDCDHCPLYAALGGPVTAQAPRAEESRKAEAAAWEFPPDRLYHRCHSWALHQENRRTRCGADAFAALLLRRVHSVIFPALYSSVQEGEAACWLVDEAELMRIRSPVSGTLVAVNRRLHANPALLSASPYDEGWLVEVLSPAPEDSRGKLVSAEKIQARTTMELGKLQQQISRHLAGDAAVGPTLADGGEPLTDLRRMLGARRYHGLIRAYLR